MYLYLPKKQEFYRDIFRPWEFSKLDIFLKVMNFCEILIWSGPNQRIFALMGRYMDFGFPKLGKKYPV